MKTIIIGLLSLLPLTMMGATSAKEKNKPAVNIDYAHEDSNQKIALDYGLLTQKEKIKQLSAAQCCKNYLTNQLLIENEKYDRLTMKKIYSNGRKSGRKVRQEIKMQLKVTMELLSQTEALTEYI